MRETLVPCAQPAARITQHALSWAGHHWGKRARTKDWVLIGCIKAGNARGLRTQEKGRSRHLPWSPLGSRGVRLSSTPHDRDERPRVASEGDLKWPCPEKVNFLCSGYGFEA
jgi:hypothetical protein